MKSPLSPLAARDPQEHHRAATPLELFFDLVSVIAIAAVTQALHHAISEGHGVEMLGNFVFLFVAIWWAWMNFTWFASAFDNDDAVYRILTMVIMAGALTFAAGAGRIFETLDFSYGVAGWIVMRIGMIGLWLRAAAAGPRHRKTALRYALGIAFAQLLWTALYLAVAPGTGMFFALSICVFAVEFAVPIFAEKAETTPWHRHHIIERYGLLNVIVLGEALLSVGLILGKLYEGHADLVVLMSAVSGITIAFALWWLYFLEREHLTAGTFDRAFIWGYGHVLVFASGALLGAGFGAYLDVATHHSKIDFAAASGWINASIGVYLFGLWLVRDRYLERGWKCHLLLGASAAFVAMALAGVDPWYAAALLVLVLAVRR